MAKRLNLLECSFMDAQDWFKETDTFMVPVGSCEKHGAHVPLGTDSYTTINVTERAAKLCSTPYTPLMPFGYSPHHMGRCGEGAGTITLSANTYRAMLSDICRSLIYHGANKIVFVTHHGSNTKPIDEFMRQIRYNYGAFVAFYKTPTERECQVVKGILQGPPEETPGWHAGEMETAQMMAHDMDLVDMSKAVQWDPDGKAHAPDWMGPNFSKTDGMMHVKFQGSENIYLPMEHHEYSDHATIGNPHRGTKEMGLALFEKEAEHLAAFIEEVKKFPFKVEHKDRLFPDRA
jgi:creatinine amidohydrolase